MKEVATRGSTLSLVAEGGWTWGDGRGEQKMTVSAGRDGLSVDERGAVVGADVRRAIETQLVGRGYCHAIGATPGVVGSTVAQVDMDTLSEALCYEGDAVCTSETEGGFAFVVGVPSVLQSGVADAAVRRRGRWRVEKVEGNGVLVEVERGAMAELGTQGRGRRLLGGDQRGMAVEGARESQEEGGEGEGKGERFYVTFGSEELLEREAEPKEFGERFVVAWHKDDNERRERGEGVFEMVVALDNTKHAVDWRRQSRDNVLWYNVKYWIHEKFEQAITIERPLDSMDGINASEHRLLSVAVNREVYEDTRREAEEWWAEMQKYIGRAERLKGEEPPWPDKVYVPVQYPAEFSRAVRGIGQRELFKALLADLVVAVGLRRPDYLESWVQALGDARALVKKAKNVKTWAGVLMLLVSGKATLGPKAIRVLVAVLGTAMVYWPEEKGVLERWHGTFFEDLVKDNENEKEKIWRFGPLLERKELGMLTPK